MRRCLMAPEARSQTTETSVLGIAAGIPFAIAQMAVAVVTGLPALTPFRLFASIVLGQAALSLPLGFAAIAGAAVHLVLSMAYGAIYGALNEAVLSERRVRLAGQAFAGLLYGTLIWLVDVQLIARAAYPWFLEAPQ